MVLDQAFTEGILEEVVPATIVRTVGILTVTSDQHTADENPFGAMGFAVVSEQARAAGIGSLPTPITNEDSDLWFVFQHWSAPVAVGSNASFGNIARVFEFESRAQRKVEEGEAIVVVLENAAAAGVGASYVVKYRLLFKLH